MYIYSLFSIKEETKLPSLFNIHSLSLKMPGVAWCKEYRQTYEMWFLIKSPLYDLSTWNKQRPDCSVWQYWIGTSSMAQIFHLSACFKCCTGQKGNESQPSKANSQGTWMNPWHIRVHSDEMSHQNNEELYPICIQQKQTVTLWQLFHRSRCSGILKKPCKTQQTLRKGSCMQVSLLQGSAQFGSLSMEELLLFAVGSAQNGFVTGRVCFNELGLQC